MDDALRRVRHVQWLVGPLVTLVAVVALLVVARYYDRLPVRPPECGFRTATGLPCLGCGGTRSVRALVSGDLAASISFNPGVVVGIVILLAWIATGWVRYLRGIEPPPISEQNRRLKRNLVIAGALFLLNWIYLLLFLP